MVENWTQLKKDFSNSDSRISLVNKRLMLFWAKLPESLLQETTIYFGMNCLHALTRISVSLRIWQKWTFSFSFHPLVCTAVSDPWKEFSLKIFEVWFVGIVTRSRTDCFKIRIKYKIFYYWEYRESSRMVVYFEGCVFLSKLLVFCF